MEKNKEQQIFAICKHKDSNEYHVFLTHRSDDQKCYFSSKSSLCGAMETSDRENCIIPCATEIQIRNKAAEIGDIVCGNCMKSIYKTKE